MKHSVKDWILTTRPWSFPASAMPVLATFAYMTWVCSLYDMQIDWVSGILAVVGIVFFHASGNMLSDVRDYKKGVDKGLDHMPLVNGSFKPQEYVRFSLILFAIGLCIGFYIMSRCGWPLLYSAVYGAFFTLTYATFKYFALGDLVILLSYAIIPIMGTTYATISEYYTPALVLALPIGLITVGILHVNNTRDIESDRAAGIRTLAMLIGRKASLKLYAFEVLFPFLLIIATVCCGWLPWYSLIVLLAAPKAWQNARIVMSAKKKGAEVLAPIDAATAQLQLIFSLLLAVSLFAAAIIG
ncbi:MAG: prenyltransferase [Bacteroidaceae bacterium]|nr:prenyltransferase [Bacteroidaceae bacterium]